MPPSSTSQKTRGQEAIALFSGEQEARMFCHFNKKGAKEEFERPPRVGSSRCCTAPGLWQGTSPSIPSPRSSVAGGSWGSRRSTGSASPDASPEERVSPSRSLGRRVSPQRRLSAEKSPARRMGNWARACCKEVGSAPRILATLSYRNTDGAARLGSRRAPKASKGKPIAPPR